MRGIPADGAESDLPTELDDLSLIATLYINGEPVVVRTLTWASVCDGAITTLLPDMLDYLLLAPALRVEARLLLIRSET
jgi:hypothetical protein